MSAKLVILAATALMTALGRADELKRLSLDDASTASPAIQADAEIKLEGSSALRITARWPTVVNLAEVSGLDVENAKLVYSAKVKTELNGRAFLELWAHVAGGQYFSRGMNDAVEGTTDWKSIQTPFLFQRGQKPDKVTLNLVINGTGTVWVDDIVLSKEPLQ